MVEVYHKRLHLGWSEYQYERKCCTNAQNFNLIMEGISRMLGKGMQQNWIQGLSASIWTPYDLEISHILYVDDILILYNAEIRQILFLRAILLSFEIVSRLHINYSKLYPVDMVHNIIFCLTFWYAILTICLLNIWGCFLRLYLRGVKRNCPT